MPRIAALHWSKVTKQTPNIKIGYPGQHLCSLITGMEGARTGARGDDLVDGTEIKSCSRVDQLDSCKSCKMKLLRIEPKCPHCGSDHIDRKQDSKWLFSIKSESELILLTKTVSRIFLMLADYPDFDSGDFETIRFQAFEIWNNTERHKIFSVIMTNYYSKIFLEHIKRNPNKTPAPKNFWPYSYQFYLCNPVKVFEAIVKDSNTSPLVEITCLVATDVDRGELQPMPMPTSLVKNNELELLLADTETRRAIEAKIKNGSTFEYLKKGAVIKKNDIEKIRYALPYIDEEKKKNLRLRDTDKISEMSSVYKRR